MCILSRRINEIDSTRIFASALDRGDHCTIYSMNIATPDDVAMILPAPVLRGGGEDTLRFVDLSGYPAIFRDMERLFPPPRSAHPDSLPAGLRPRASETLKVYTVGRFAASYVPTPDDFGRLDPQFRLDPSAWATLPDYQGFGFAVFQLDRNRGLQPIHPMAYVYPPERPSEIFFPTVHVHDGKTAERKARFDHHLYYQESPAFPEARAWERSRRPVDECLNLGKAQGLLTGRPIRRARIKGVRRNADQILAVRFGRLVHKKRGGRAA